MGTKRWSGLVVVSVLAGSGVASAGEPSRLSDSNTVARPAMETIERWRGALALANETTGSTAEDATVAEADGLAEGVQGSIIWVNSSEPDIIWVDPEETAVATSDQAGSSQSELASNERGIVWVTSEEEDAEDAAAQQSADAIARSAPVIEFGGAGEDPFDRAEAEYEASLAQAPQAVTTEALEGTVAQAQPAGQPGNTVAASEMASALPAVGGGQADADQTEDADAADADDAVASAQPGEDAAQLEEGAPTGAAAQAGTVAVSAAPATTPDTTQTPAPAAAQTVATAAAVTPAPAPAPTPAVEPAKADAANTVAAVAAATVTPAVEPAKAEPTAAVAAVAAVAAATVTPAIEPVKAEPTAAVAAVAQAPAKSVDPIQPSIAPAAEAAQVATAIPAEPTEPASTTPVTLPEHATASVSRHAVYSPVSSAPRAAEVAAVTLPASTVAASSADHGNVPTAAAVIPAAPKAEGTVKAIESNKPGAPRSITIQMTGDPGRYQTHFDITVTETPQP